MIINNEIEKEKISDKQLNSKKENNNILINDYNLLKKSYTELRKDYLSNKKNMKIL